MIPLFDLNDFESDKEGFAQDLGQALRHFGFVRLKGHGIPAEKLKSMYDDMAQFFAQPQDVKSRHWLRGNEGIMSYTKDFEQARGAKKVDKKEEWCIRTRLPDDHALAGKIDALLTVPEVPSFKPSVLNLTAAFEKATVKLMRPLSLYMGLEERWFDDKFDNSHSTMRLLHYPTAGTGGSHIDLNFLTWLTSDRPGLYVTDRSGQEHEVVVGEGEMILNGGMQLGLFTNDDLKPSWHRVAATEPRETIVFFVHPNPDFMLAPLPKFAGSPPAITPDYFPADGQPISVANFVDREVKKIFTGGDPKP